MMRGDRTIGQTEDWLSAHTGDELMMMSARKGMYLGLNKMGARIWDLLADRPDYEHLCARLIAEFDVGPEQCRREVDAFLSELEEHGAITLSAPVVSEAED
jgi:hypothetical protein